jgi:hypothetical protein
MFASGRNGNTMKTTKALFGTLTIIAALTVQVQSQSFLTNGLVAYYPFNGNANDVSGYGNDLTNYGAILCADRFGNTNQAFHFDGVSSYMMSSSMDLPLPSGAADRTLSLWVKLDNVNAGTYDAVDIGNADNSYNATFGLFIQGLWGVHFVGVNDDVFSSIQPDTSWHQFVCVYSSGNVEMFMDGIEYVNTPRPTSTGYGQLIVGAFWGGASEFFPGIIDDIRIYNRALSSNEVAQLFAIESIPPIVITPPYLNLTIDLNISKQSISNVIGIVSTTASPKLSTLATKDILNKLAFDAYVEGNWPSNSFPKDTTVALAGNGFIVLNGTNILLNVSDIMSFTTDEPKVTSGKQNTVTGLASPTTQKLQIASITFDDTFINGGNNLKFYLNGVLSMTMADTTPVDGVYTETQTCKTTAAAGDGSSQGIPFICTGSVSANGKSPLHL